MSELTQRLMTSLREAHVTIPGGDFGLLFLLLGMIGLHLVAIAVYRLRGTDLVRPMLGGDKLLPPQVPPSRDDVRTRALALLLAVAAAALAVWVGAQGG